MFFFLPSGHQWTNSPGWYPVSTKLACFPPARMTIPSGDWIGWDCQVRPTIGLVRHRLCLKGDIRDLCDINHNDPWLTFLILHFWDHCEGFTTIYKQAALSKSLLEFLDPMPARLIMTSHAHTLLSYTTFLNQGHQVDRSTWGEKSSTSDRLSFVVILMAPKKETAPPGYPFSISHAKVENVTIGTGDYMFPRQPDGLEVWFHRDVFCCVWKSLVAGRCSKGNSARSGNSWQRKVPEGPSQVVFVFFLGDKGLSSKRVS